MFLRFYNVAGGSTAHPNDHERFNEFIRCCDSEKVDLSTEKFRQILVDIGRDKERADPLSIMYYNDRTILDSNFL